MLWTLVLAWLAGSLLRWWQAAPPVVPIVRRAPASGALVPSVELTPTDHCNRLVTEFQRSLPNPEDASAPEPTADRGNWPGFRGPNRDGIVPESVPLAERWPEAGPPVLWTVAVGDGHAGPAVFRGSVVVLDYDETAKADTLVCLSLADGREVWRRSYPVLTKRNHGMSRTVPAVTDDCIVTMGPQCHVMCVDRVSGDYRWGLDLVRDYGSTVPLWYTAQCPLVDQGLAILAPCGRDLLLAIDTKTGQVVWRTPNPHRWAMSHSSVVLMRFGERRAFVYTALGGIAAVAADGPDRGAVLWSSSEWNKKIVAPCPVQLDAGRLLVTAGHGAGSALVHVAQSEGAWTVTHCEPLAKTLFASEQQTPLWLDGLLYTVLPRDAGEHREELVCYDPAGSGRLLWTSGKSQRFGLGPYIVADGKLLVLDDRGVLTLARVGRQGFQPLARAVAIPDGRDAWGPPALVGGRLLLRDATRLVCLDVSKGIEPKEK
jgi:outer membrane protein assembly factor BamB